MQERFSKLEHEMIAALYASAAELVPPSRPLELLVELTRSDKAFLAWFDLEKKRGGILATFNVEPHFIETYNELYAAQNPWLARESYFQAEGLVWRGAEIVEPARLRETEFYKLFLYGQAIGPTLHLVVRVREPVVFHVMLTRRSNSEDYDSAAVELCRHYAAHARRAFDVSDAGATRRFVLQAADAAIDELAAGVAIVEAPSTVLHSNATFEALLSAVQAPLKPQTPAVQRFLRLSKPNREVRLPKPLIDALSANPVPGFCNISTGLETRPLTVGIRPLRLSGPGGGDSRQGYVLIARAAETAFEVDEAPLRAAYQLTAAEARICSALISGDNVYVLSERLGISPQTARTHLKRIYDKTGTTRQAELLRLLMTFAYRRPPVRGTDAPRPGTAASNVLALRPDQRFTSKE